MMKWVYADRRRRQTLGSLQRRAADLVWAAGYIDGEGLVRLEGGTASLRVGNTHKASLDRLKVLFGGSVKPRKRKKPRRPYFCWSISGPRARVTLRNLYPLLVEKAPQVEVVLSIHPNRQGAPLTEDQRHQRREAQLELRRLKKLVSS